MERGRIAFLSDNPSEKRWEARDAEDRATKEWLEDILYRWIMANTFFERLAVAEEYHFAFCPKGEEKEEIESLFGFRQWIDSLL